MQNISRPDTQKTSSIAAGAGGELSWYLVASAIPESYPIVKQALVYFSPTASLCFSYLWAWAYVNINERLAKSNSARIVARAIELRDKIVADPASSQEHKRRVQESVEKLQMVEFEILQDSSRSFRTIAAGSGTKNPGD